MFDDYTICPYTGLRSFSEEESLFFKGRDKQIDQITRLLEKNKFLMVTGASGEGKSSLVYGGMIPNARAGFFKATYNNWQVVDFRPERTPLKNFATALSQKLGYSGRETVETELARGYAALIDIYKNSNWYYEETDEFWQNKPEEDKVSSKRQASNLLIIVDQFEEFFTNPENYVNSKPSEASQITLNLLLETAKIALAQNLPIYVVCTMRSDYIGQCTAFRGLPEAIGFSQFFVPRLKRNELKLIIEEPALLNGNKISKRLVERLLFDLSEGIDQLPILQHALSHIWHAADNGKEELDLIHYALVGGMPSAELPDEDKPRFIQWFKTLPEFQRKLYHQPGIKKIIEIHANQLYEGAYNYYKESNPNTNLSLPEVKQVVAITFTCLTKIDDSRAVRNRMTLAEITGIINKPHITTRVVNDILNIFREPDNSFIRPFITDDTGSKVLVDDAVLDITHESLIRNWGLLNKWANKEFEYYTTFLDFRKQLNRWLKSGKSQGYLLPIGPLSYFENWENECKPNKYWIYRYEGNNGIWPDNLEEAAELLDEAREFLKRSNRKVLVARTFMKYGASRIAAVTAVLLVAFLSSFYFIDAEKKRNDNVLETVISRGNALLSSKAIVSDQKAMFLLINETREPGSLLTYLTTNSTNPGTLDLALNVYRNMLGINKKYNGDVKTDVIALIKEQISAKSKLTGGSSDYIEQMTQFITLLSYDYYYNNNPQTLALLKELNETLFTTVVNKIEQNQDISGEAIDRTVQFYLTFNNPSEAELNKLLEQIDPFATPESYQKFTKYYAKEKTSRNGRITMLHNGGYHFMASVYAAVGDKQHLLQAMDSLLLSKDYFVSLPFNAPANLIGILYQYKHTSLVEPVIEQIAKHSNNTKLAVRKDILDRSGFLKHLFSTNIDPNISESNAGYYSPNLLFLPVELVATLYNDTQQEIDKLKDKNERLYQSALLLKQETLFKHKYYFDRGLDFNPADLKSQLSDFDKLYSAIDNEFLSESVQLIYRYYGGGLRNRLETRKHILIYPDHIGGFFSETYHSPLFFDYLEENELLDKIFTEASDLQLLNYWVANAHEVYSFINEEIFKNDFPFKTDYLNKIGSFISAHPAGRTTDTNLVNIILANKYFEAGNIELALAVVPTLEISSYQGTAKQFEYLNEAFFLNQVAELAGNLALVGEYNAAVTQIETYSNDIFKAEAYIQTANKLYKQGYNPVAFDLLDSVYSIRSRIKEQDLRQNNDYRFNLTFGLALIGGNRNEILIDAVQKSMYEIIQPFLIETKAYGYAAGGDYYAALTSVGDNLTESGELRSFGLMLLADQARNQSWQDEGLWQGVSAFFDHIYNYQFNVRGL